MARTLLIGLTALACCFPAWSAPAKPLVFYVAADGNDAWSGRRAGADRARTDGPFATLERARDEIRALKRAGGLPAGGVIVEVAAGAYERTGPFALTAEDSGTAGSPIEYRARNGAEVRLIGGRRVTHFRSVTDRAVLARLDPAARGRALVADLHALGITDFGEVKGGGLELFFQDRPMTLARWPNEGFTKIVDVVGGKPLDVRGTVGDEIGKFTYAGDRPKRWAGEKDIWVHGYWFWDWADEREKVASIDTARRIISLVPPYHTYGYRKGQWFYAFNLLSELDSPGEWYLDRETGLLYFWPPAPLREGKPTVSVLPNLITLKDVSHITFRGFTLEAARGDAVTVEGGDHDRIADCTIRNVGGYAVRISGGARNGVTGCEITQTGDGGIVLAGGDRKTLTPAGHYADGNRIHHYSRWNRMYQPAISLEGVGNRAAHNLIYDAPHQAIAFSGNDHVIEYNEIHDVCTEANDAGAIYSGRDWTWRGTQIRYNYFHDIRGYRNQGSVGVYLDDMLSGTRIFGNVFVRVTAAAFIGGGRDNTVENNIFVDCDPAVHLDGRALTWAAYHVDTTMKSRLLEVPYQQPPWSTRYPELLTLLDDRPGAPKGNVIARNICVGGKWKGIEDDVEPLATFRDNLIDVDPHFVDAAHGDYRLRDDSPAYGLGFQRIPMDKIGRQRK